MNTFDFYLFVLPLGVLVVFAAALVFYYARTREKNESIYQFILDVERKKNRELVLREKALRERTVGETLAQVQGPTEQLVTTPQSSSIVPEELSKEETLSLSERNQPASVKIELGILTVVAASSLISIVVLLRLDAIIHQDLYSYGLQFSFEWATPYWIAIRTVLGLLWFTVIGAVPLQMYVLTHKSRGKGTNEQWKTYALADGSTIRVKTVVKGVKRLKEHSHDGKPVYSIEADNMVEVLEAPQSLMAPRTRAQNEHES